ncbi:Uncharacterised protein [uncultured archaeon]|nr:Uncharacterised protein [uncultured archaeon]
MIIGSFSKLCYTPDEIFCFQTFNQENETKSPFNVTFSQMEIIEKLSKPPNRHEIQIKATEKLNYIKDLMDKKIIEITKDDYS